MSAAQGRGPGAFRVIAGYILAEVTLGRLPAEKPS